MLDRLSRLLGTTADQASTSEAYDPVYGLPKRAVEDWLARNPRLKEEYAVQERLARNPPLSQQYEAERRKKRGLTSPGL